VFSSVAIVMCSNLISCLFLAFGHCRYQFAMLGTLALDDDEINEVVVPRAGESKVRFFFFAVVWGN
jgi:hypothetical protein